MNDSRERLAELVRILSNGSVEGDTSTARMERIRHLTRLLADRGTPETDEADAVAMRLLLNEYGVAMTQLRTAARESAERVDRASITLSDARRLIKHRLEQQEKRLAAVGPSEAPPAS